MLRDEDTEWAETCNLLYEMEKELLMEIIFRVYVFNITRRRIKNIDL
jgi:hypothetical protein